MRLAGLERELTGWDYEVKRLEVLTDAKKAFVDVLATAERLAFTADLLRLAEQVQRTVSARVHAGKVSPIEETRTRVDGLNRSAPSPTSSRTRSTKPPKNA